MLSCVVVFCDVGLGSFFCRLGGVLGRCFVVLGVSWYLVVLRGLGGSWRPLEASWGHLGRS